MNTDQGAHFFICSEILIVLDVLINSSKIIDKQNKQTAITLITITLK